MEEKDNVIIENEEVANETPAVEEVEVAEVAETTVAEDGKKPSPFSGIKDQPGIKAKVKFFFDVLEKYPDAREMVMYMLFSMLCGLGQMGSQFILQYTLIYVPALQPSFQWFIFKNNSIAEFIGFLVGAIVGNVLTYILNRKKTFRATNNLALSISLYTIMVVAITIMQAAVPGWITTACVNSYKANFGGAPEGFVGFLITLTGTAVGGIAALVLSFLGNKFVVMRDWGKKKNAVAVEEIASTEENTDVE